MTDLSFMYQIIEECPYLIVIRIYEIAHQSMSSGKFKHVSVNSIAVANPIDSPHCSAQSRKLFREV